MTPTEHRCLACNFTLVPVYRAFCRRCFPVIPWELRADVMDAFRMRFVETSHYQFQLRRLRRWARDNPKEMA